MLTRVPPPGRDKSGPYAPIVHVQHLVIRLIAYIQSYLRECTGQLICMLWQTYGHAHEVVQVGMMKVAQQDSMGFDHGADALETDLFVTDTGQDEVALRRDGFQVRLTGKYFEEACSFLDNFAYIAHDIVQVIERGDGGDMAGDVHLEGALGPPHVPGNPLGEEPIPNKKTCHAGPLAKSAQNDQ